MTRVNDIDVSLVLYRVTGQGFAVGVSVCAWASHLVLGDCRTQTVRELLSNVLVSGLVSALQEKVLSTW